MNTEELFKSASERVHNLDQKPSNDVLLKLYALYKQATEGDVTGTRPAGFDFKAIAKYDAWAGLKGMQPEEAKKSYVEFVDSLFHQ